MPGKMMCKLFIKHGVFVCMFLGFLVSFKNQARAGHVVENR